MRAHPRGSHYPGLSPPPPAWRYGCHDVSLALHRRGGPRCPSTHMSLDTPDRRSTRASSGKKHIEEAVDLLYRRRWIILGVFLAVAVAAGAYVVDQRPVYRTSALVLVDLDRSREPAGTEVAETGPFVRDNRSVFTELFVLNASRGIRERVTERLRGPDGEMPPGSVGFALADRNVPSGIRIEAASPDPEAAAALANAYAEEYVKQTQIASRSYLTSTREFLEDQAGRLRAELEAAEGGVAGQVAAAGAAALGSSALLGQLSSLRAQRDEARIEAQTRRNRLQSINSQLEDITPRLADRMASGTERRVASVEQSIAEQEDQLRLYEARESAGRPIDQGEVQRIRRRIAELEREKEALAGRFVGEVMDAGGIAAPGQALSYVTDLKGQAAQEQIALSGLEGRIAQLSRRIAELEREADRAPGQVTAIERATRDREQAAQMYESVSGRLQEVTVAEESEPGYARVLREAPVPAAPSGTSPFKVLGLALLGGLGLGVALAVARDRVDTRVHKPEHVSALGVPVLEAVPDLGKMIQREFDGADAIDVGGRPVSSDVVAAHAPLSPASETFRHLRTAVQFSRPDTVVRTVVVTSAGPGDGKSTIASNLAVTFAQAGRRTVLLDTDFRRPRLHDVFQDGPSTGLAHLVRTADSWDGPDGRAELSSELERAFSTGVDGLFVVPTGAVAVEGRADSVPDGRLVVPNPSELLGSADLRRLLEALLDVVDVVVVDTPPVLAATDAVLLSTQADATLFVARAGVTKAGDIGQALAHLDDVGARVVGAVLNRFSLEHALGYAYTYSHYSSYGPYSRYGAYADGPSGAGRRRADRRAGDQGTGAAPDA